MLWNLLLAIASTSPMLLVFVLQTQTNWLPQMPDYGFYLLIGGGVVILNLLVRWIFELRSQDSLETGALVQIESADESFLPNYLGYFFVALSIQDTGLFFMVYALVTILVCFSQSMYYNPTLLFLKYHFYYVTTESRARILLISKQEYLGAKGISFDSLCRISDYTYFEP